MRKNSKYVVVVDSARERAYRTLRSKIVNLELSPGTLLSAQSVSEILSISRTPVREAFLKLQEEHLLEISHQKPSVVSKIDLKRVEQECFARTALELENMRMFAASPLDEIIEEMRENIQNQEEALENGKYELYQELDNEFHLLPFSATHQELAATLISQMNGHYDRARMLIRRDQELSNDITGEHKKLLESITRRDVDMAVEHLRCHIQAIQPLQDRLIQKWPEFFV